MIPNRMFWLRQVNNLLIYSYCISTAFKKPTEQTLESNQKTQLLPVKNPTAEKDATVNFSYAITSKSENYFQVRTKQ
jgi:hypothetical protein